MLSFDQEVVTILLYFHIQFVTVGNFVSYKNQLVCWWSCLFGICQWSLDGIASLPPETKWWRLRTWVQFRTSVWIVLCSRTKSWEILKCYMFLQKFTSHTYTAIIISLAHLQVLFVMGCCVVPNTSFIFWERDYSTVSRCLLLS